MRKFKPGTVAIFAILIWQSSLLAQPVTDLAPSSGVFGSYGQNHALPPGSHEKFLSSPEMTAPVLRNEEGTLQQPDFQTLDSMVFGTKRPYGINNGVQILRREAANNNPDAEFRLGAIYELGIGVEKDQEAAFKLYFEAAEGGLPQAQHALGRAFLNGVGTYPDYQQAIRWLKAAHEAGSHDAAIDLARSTQFGWGTPVDLSRSEQLWQEALNTRSTDAYLGYAAYLLDSKELSPTSASVRQLVEQAADRSDPTSARIALDLAVAAKDVEAQRKWLARVQIFSDAGDSAATAALGDYYGAPSSELANLNDSVKYYRIAASVGNPYAQARLGTLLLENPSLDPSFSGEDATSLVREAAGSGEPSAFLTLASLSMEQGDRANAYSLATTASELGGQPYSGAADAIRLRSCAELIDMSCEPVPVFYVTNREALVQGTAVQFANRLAVERKLSFGLSLVSVPTSPQVDVAEKSTREILLDYLTVPLRRWFPADPPDVQEAEVSSSLSNSTFEEFVSRLAQTAEANDRDKVIVYVHGFANTFDDAARRLALFSEQFKYPGIPVLLSWASAGEPFIRTDESGGYTGVGYLNDLQSVGSSCAEFQVVLEKIVDRFGPDNVIVFAHSMGGQLVDYVFAGCPYGSTSWDKTKVLDGVVLAAPDVDVQDFQSHLDKIRKSAKHFTIYVSANDAALHASQRARGDRRRLGQGGPERFLASGLMTIDATAVKGSPRSDPQNHSNVFDVPEVKRDISDLLRGRFDPNLRDCPQPYKDPASDIDYWLLQPGCTM